MKNRILLSVALIALPSVASAQIMLGSAKAIDGDTFAFGDDVIRIHGIDALEATQTCSRDNEVWECGKAATNLMRELLSHGNLQCRQMDRDHYGRAVSVCAVGGRDIGQEMVAAGLAVALPQYSTSYITAEERARAQGEGIWSWSFQMPADYRAENPHFEEPRPPERKAQIWSSTPTSPHHRSSQDVYYRNCDAARAAGAAPIRRGEPGYRPFLDADNDGIACEPYHGRR